MLNLLYLLYLLFSCSGWINHSSSISFEDRYEWNESEPNDYIVYTKEDSTIVKRNFECSKIGMVDGKIQEKNSEMYKLWFDVCVVEFKDDVKE